MFGVPVGVLRVFSGLHHLRHASLAEKCGTGEEETHRGGERSQRALMTLAMCLVVRRVVPLFVVWWSFSRVSKTTFDGAP